MAVRCATALARTGCPRALQGRGRTGRTCSGNHGNEFDYAVGIALHTAAIAARSLAVQLCFLRSALFLSTHAVQALLLFSDFEQSVTPCPAQAMAAVGKGAASQSAVKALAWIPGQTAATCKKQ